MARQRLCDCGECQRCKHRAYMVAYYWSNRDKVCETARKTRARNLETIREYDRRRGHRPSTPEKQHARSAVANAIEHGRLVRQPCEVCGNPKTDAHHEDYSKPLEVEWLCKRHHGERHRAPLLAEETAF